MNWQEGILDDVEEIQEAKQGSYRRIRIGKLFFSIWDYCPQFKAIESFKGKYVHVAFEESESDFGRTYRNVMLISEYSPPMLRMEKEIKRLQDRVKVLEAELKAVRNPPERATCDFYDFVS